MSSALLQTVRLGTPWQTVDPFLFCVHHLDIYPTGNAVAGPCAPLDGRDLGMDFAGVDGWRMYHGRAVPGFPQHPHRGFETVTFVRRGLVDHADSLGAAARYGGGDVQWMTAGQGIVHAEMFPLLDRDEPNTLELFQIWLNLPGDDKLVAPHFSMLWDDEIPRHRSVDDGGKVTEVTVVAGPLAGLVPASPPPRSWAARPDSDVAVWHIRLEPGARWVLPPAGAADTIRTLYAFDGGPVLVDGDVLAGGHGGVVRATEPVQLHAALGADCLVLQGRPIGEPVAQYGPFVMNTSAEIERAFEDYRRTGFGGWPWPSDEPVHSFDPARFARHVDGSVDRPVAVSLG